MRRLTTPAIVLALLGALAGCGNSAPSGPPYHYSAQRKDAVLAFCESYYPELAQDLKKTAESGEYSAVFGTVRATALAEQAAAIGQHVGEECQCYVAKVEASTAPDKPSGQSGAITECPRNVVGPISAFEQKAKAKRYQEEAKEEAAHVEQQEEGARAVQEQKDQQEIKEGLKERCTREDEKFGECKVGEAISVRRP